jgi:hypothetical protein
MAAVNRMQIAERIRLVLNRRFADVTPLAILMMWRARGAVMLAGCSGPYGLREAAAVSLSAHEQRALSGIADELAASDPKLASVLSVFNRLTRGEELPIRRDTGKSRRPESDNLRRSRGRTRKHRRTVRVAWRAVVAWILISAVLITAGIMLSHTGHGDDGRWRCTQSWPVSCARRLCSPGPDRANARDRQELAILTMWTAEDAVMLNHWARRPQPGPWKLAQDRL